MRLTVFERMQLQNLLPKEGNYVTLKLVRKLREALSFSEKEIGEIEFKNHWQCQKCNTKSISAQAPKCESCGAYMATSGMVNWDEAKALKVIKDVHHGKAMQDLIRSTLQKLSDEDKLSESTMSLYEKYCVDEEEE